MHLVACADMGQHHDHHHHDMGAVSAPMDHHAAVAAAAANAGVPLDMGPADDPAHAPIPGLEPVDHPLPDDSPQARVTPHMRPASMSTTCSCRWRRWWRMSCMPRLRPEPLN